MLYYGMNITQQGDPLFGVEIDELQRRLRNPKQAISELVGRLRILQGVDPARYGQLKKQLPYLVCGLFKPMIRRKDHFVSIRYFFLDLDHVSGHHDFGELRSRLCTDPEIKLLFTSPGGDGMKLLFELDQPCYDAGMYAVFYKLFAESFAARHGLEHVIDPSTKDVSRACFISVDEDAWYRSDVVQVCMQQYVNEGNADEAIEASGRIELRAIKVEDTNMQSGEELEATKGPDTQTLQAIRQRLNPRALRIPREKQHFQPRELDVHLPEIAQQLQALGMTLASVAPISFGKQLRVVAANQWAEINLFFGKKGFTVVRTTKTGSNPELAELAAVALNDIVGALPLN